MVSAHLYHVLWLLAHTIVTLIIQARDVYLLVYNRLVRGLFSARSNEDLFTELQKLQQLPQHLTVLLPSSPPGAGAQAHQLDVLVNLVLFSLATNISYVSFYDPIGLLVKKEEELIKRIQHKMDKSQHLIWHGMSTSGRNGFAGPKIHVKIITTGRSSLVDSCRELAHRPEALTVSQVCDHQAASYEFPDPQLAIYFGTYLNTCGYPPWQLRLTEFVNGGAFGAFDAERFHGVLDRYSQCQQRAGK